MFILTQLATLVVLALVSTAALALLVVSIKMSRKSVRTELSAVASAVGSWSKNRNGQIKGLKNLAVLERAGTVLSVDPRTGKASFIKHKQPSDEAIGRLIGR